MTRRRTLALIPAAALVLTACGGTGDETTTGEPAVTLTTEADQTAEGDQTAEPTGTSTDATTDDSTDSAAGSSDARFGTAADVGGPYGELRDGVWAVGPAGEVEFRVTGPDALELVDAPASSGWSITEQEVESDKIEIDFRSGEVQYTFEVQMEDGVLEIEIDQDIDPAQPGTFHVGAAAIVELSLEAGRIVLGDVTVNDGWTETARDVEDDDIDLDFRRDGNGFFELWELDADLDDGVLEIQIDYEIEGPFSS